MANRLLWCLAVAAGCLSGGNAYAEQGTKVTVRNPTGDVWVDAPVVVQWKAGMPGKEPKLLTARGTTESLAVQADDLNGDGVTDELVFLVSLQPGESKQFTLTEVTPKSPVDRAHAGMYLKDDKIKGMEGPGWESDLVAYRLYWDKRNATDVFCKTQPILSLEAFAAKGLDYHRTSKWGLDVLKVGTALGIGGFGVWLDGKVHKVEDAEREYKLVANGPVRAVSDLIYTNWKVGDRQFRLKVRMLIYGGQKWAEAQTHLEAADGGSVPELVTGIVKHTDTELIRDEKAAIAGRWGLQALGDGEVPKSANLGLGVIADPADVVAIGEDDVNTYMRLKTPGGDSRYRYHASWIREPDAATSTGEYEQMLRRVARLKPDVKVEF